MSLLLVERETIILFNEAEKTAEIEVYSSRLKRRLEQLCKDRPREIRIVKQNNPYSTVYEFPKSWIKINPTKKMSEEQLEAMRKSAKANFTPNPTVAVEV